MFVSARLTQLSIVSQASFRLSSDAVSPPVLSIGDHINIMVINGAPCVRLSRHRLTHLPSLPNEEEEEAEASAYVRLCPS